MKWAPLGASITPSTIERLIASVWNEPSVEQLVGGHDPLARHEAPARRAGAEEQVVEVQVGPEELGVAPLVGAVEVHERGVEAEGGDGEQLLAVVVRRRHRAQATG